MEGGDFYEELLKKNLAVGYMKQLETAVAPDALINIRINYLMSCIATTTSHNLTSDVGLSNRNPADERLSPPEVNTKPKEPVRISTENHEVHSEQGAESEDDGLEIPQEDKFEILSDSEPQESSNENLSEDEPKSKRLRKKKETSENAPEIKIEIEERTTDSNLIENKVSSPEIVFNLINNAVIMENIFKHLPLADLLNFRTVSTDWDQKIITHLDKNNILLPLKFGAKNNNELILVMKSSKQIPFTKFNLTCPDFHDKFHPPLKETIQQLLTICGSSIKHLTIMTSDFTEKYCQFVPNIESLHLIGDLKSNSNSGSEEPEDDDIVFSKLTDITYTLQSNETVRTFFQSTPNLNRLEIRNPQSVHEKYMIVNLMTTGRLANITKLHLDTLGESTFQFLFKATLTPGLFLEEFFVNAIDKDIELVDLKEFLSSQYESLKKLEIKETFQRTMPIKPSEQSKSNGKPYEREIHNLRLKNMIALRLY